MFTIENFESYSGSLNLSVYRLPEDDDPTATGYFNDLLKYFPNATDDKEIQYGLRMGSLIAVTINSAKAGQKVGLLLITSISVAGVITVAPFANVFS